MASLDELTTKVASARSVQGSVEILLADLAQRIKATSNDQNIQRLAHDLKQGTPGLVSAIAGKPMAGASA